MARKYVHGRELFRMCKQIDTTDERGPGAIEYQYAFMFDGKVLRHSRSITVNRPNKWTGWKLAKPKDRMPTEQFEKLLASKGYIKVVAQ